MTFQTFTDSTAGRWLWTAVCLLMPFSPPFVILAYKYRKGTPLESWGLWFAFDLVLLFMGKLHLAINQRWSLTDFGGRNEIAFGSLSQIWSRLQGLSMQSIGLQIGLPTSIMYIFCIARESRILFQLFTRTQPSSEYRILQSLCSLFGRFVVYS